MKTKIIQNIKSIILALILVVGVSYVSAYSTWSNPTATAPGNNADTPLNTGSSNQIKSGNLLIKATGLANGFIVENGNVGFGTITPTQKLDINGTTKTTQINAGQYCDVNGANCKTITAMGGGAGGYTGQLWRCSCPYTTVAPLLGTMLNDSNQTGRCYQGNFSSENSNDPYPDAVNWVCTRIQ